MSIIGKWRVEIYKKDGSGKYLSSVFIKEFRSDSTYIYFTTFYKKNGDTDSNYEHSGTYKFTRVNDMESGWPGEKIKGKQLYLLTREMDKKKGFIITRYVQFENENRAWIWGRAPGLCHEHLRIIEEKK